MAGDKQRIKITGGKRKGKPFIGFEYDDININVDDYDKMEEVENLAQTVAVMLNAISMGIKVKDINSTAQFKDELNKKQNSKYN